jgi:hypothetical protein
MEILFWFWVWDTRMLFGLPRFGLSVALLW